MLGLKTTAIVSSAALVTIGLLGCTENGEPSSDAQVAGGTEGAPGETDLGDSTTQEPEVVDASGIEAFRGETYSVISTHTLDSGIVVDELHIGEGAECPEGATVTMDYHGTFLDGNSFDSSRGKDPLTDWPLTKFIEGWQLGVPGMKTGGVRRLTIPYQYAYGEAGGGPIPPKTDLVFVIQLVSFKQ